LAISFLERRADMIALKMPRQALRGIRTRAALAVCPLLADVLTALAGLWASPEDIWDGHRQDFPGSERLFVLDVHQRNRLYFKMQ
jgi:hypothetical protein